MSEERCNFLTYAKVVQENHYYPLGMNMKGIEKEPGAPNQFQYNAKTEKETSLGLNWYETPFRRYDAQLGRLHGVDALAENYMTSTPFHYSLNNPISMNDPSGLLAESWMPDSWSDGSLQSASSGASESRRSRGQNTAWSDFKGAVNDVIDKQEEEKEHQIPDESDPILRAWLLFRALTYYATQGIISVTESYLDSKVNSDDPYEASVATTLEFILGIGPESREFNEDNSSLATSLKESHMTTLALEAWYDAYVDYLNGDRTDQPKQYRVDFSPFAFDGDTGPLTEFIKDGKFTTAQFTGTAMYYFKVQGAYLNVYVYDTKNEYSLFLHMPGTDRHKRSEQRLFGETYQHYHFGFHIDEVTLRVRGE